MMGQLARLLKYLASQPVRGSGELCRAIANRVRRRNPLLDEVPWMPFAAIAFLRGALSPGDRIFEYGSGGSTVFFARRAAEVVTVEHDARWAREVAAAISRRGIRNVELLAIAPGKNHDPEFLSEVAAFQGLSFQAYVTSIDRFPDRYFSAVVVDGRARNACLRRALRKVREGGLLILDNSDRTKYREGLDFLAGFERRDFHGLNPYQIDPGQTTVWFVGPQ